MSSTNDRPSGPSDHPRPQPSSAPARPSFSSSLATTLLGVSATIERLQALDGTYPLDEELRGELRRTVRQLEALIQRLRQAPDHTPPGRTPTTATSPELPRRADLEAGFLAWLGSSTRPDVVHLGQDDENEFPLTVILGALSTSTSPLPPDAAAILGLPAGTTIGAAAAELILAVNDPAGPRCRSYRAATYFLEEHRRIDLVAADLEAALR